MTWQQFSMRLDRLDSEQVEAALGDAGALSVTLTDAGDDPVLEPAPGETPLWHDTRVTALFDSNADMTAVATHLAGVLGVEALPPWSVEVLQDRDWEREWLRDYAPMRFGRRLWICPQEADAPAGAVVVRLEPGLAFGTGTHATTALCLEWLDSLDLEGSTLLDYGCGSGVLAIAALRLGCRRALAIDIDRQALTATHDNARRNDVADRLVVAGNSGTIDETFDFVVANILAGPLETLAESLVTRLSSGGELALSGILSGQVNKMQSAYGRWIDFEPPVTRLQGGQTWALLKGRRTA